MTRESAGEKGRERERERETERAIEREGRRDERGAHPASILQNDNGALLLT